MAFFTHPLTRMPEPRGAMKAYSDMIYEDSLRTKGKQMAETLKEPATEENGEPARSRKQPKQPRKRRNFVAELQALQSRRDMAVTLLVRCIGHEGEPGVSESVCRELVAVAIETLKGEP